MHYGVVALVRKKIVFEIRPKPIIREEHKGKTSCLSVPAILHCFRNIVIFTNITTTILIFVFIKIIIIIIM